MFHKLLKTYLFCSPKSIFLVYWLSTISFLFAADPGFRTVRIHEPVPSTNANQNASRLIYTEQASYNAESSQTAWPSFDMVEANITFDDPCGARLKISPVGGFFSSNTQNSWNKAGATGNDLVSILDRPPDSDLHANVQPTVPNNPDLVSCPASTGSYRPFTIMRVAQFRSADNFLTAALITGDYSEITSGARLRLPSNVKLPGFSLDEGDQLSAPFYFPQGTNCQAANNTSQNCLAMDVFDTGGTTAALKPIAATSGLSSEADVLELRIGVLGSKTLLFPYFYIDPTPPVFGSITLEASTSG